MLAGGGCDHVSELRKLAHSYDASVRQYLVSLFFADAAKEGVQYRNLVQVVAHSLICSSSLLHSYLLNCSVELIIMTKVRHYWSSPIFTLYYDDDSWLRLDHFYQRV
jgi:hypothetical protein